MQNNRELANDEAVPLIRRWYSPVARGSDPARYNSVSGSPPTEYLDSMPMTNISNAPNRADIPESNELYDGGHIQRRTSYDTFAYRTTFHNTYDYPREQGTTFRPSPASIPDSLALQPFQNTSHLNFTLYEAAHPSGYDQFASMGGSSLPLGLPGGGLGASSSAASTMIIPYQNHQHLDTILGSKPCKDRIEALKSATQLREEYPPTELISNEPLGELAPDGDIYRSVEGSHRPSIPATSRSQHRQYLDPILFPKYPKGRRRALELAIQFRDEHDASILLPNELLDGLLRKTDDSRYTCFCCDHRKGTTTTSARDHVRRSLGNFPYSCPNSWCRHSSLRKADLNKHKRTCSKPDSHLLSSPPCRDNSKSTEAMPNQLAFSQPQRFPNPLQPPVYGQTIDRVSQGHEADIPGIYTTNPVSVQTPVMERDDTLLGNSTTPSTLIEPIHPPPEFLPPGDAQLAWEAWLNQLGTIDDTLADSGTALDLQFLLGAENTGGDRNGG